MTEADRAKRFNDPEGFVFPNLEEANEEEQQPTQEAEDRIRPEEVQRSKRHRVSKKEEK